MQLSRHRPDANQPHLQFMDPSQTEPWTSLNTEQQQICRELLSQLMQQILCDPSGIRSSEERGAVHE
jgi:hypothetical protein